MAAAVLQVLPSSMSLPALTSDRAANRKLGISSGTTTPCTTASGSGKKNHALSRFVGSPPSFRCVAKIVDGAESRKARQGFSRDLCLPPIPRSSPLRSSPRARALERNASEPVLNQGMLNRQLPHLSDAVRLPRTLVEHCRSELRSESGECLLCELTADQIVATKPAGQMQPLQQLRVPCLQKFGKRVPDLPLVEPPPWPPGFVTGLSEDTDFTSVVDAAASGATVENLAAEAHGEATEERAGDGTAETGARKVDGQSGSAAGDRPGAGKEAGRLQTDDVYGSTSTKEDDEDDEKANCREGGSSSSSSSSGFGSECDKDDAVEDGEPLPEVSPEVADFLRANLPARVGEDSGDHGEDCLGLGPPIGRRISWAGGCDLASADSLARLQRIGRAGSHPISRGMTDVVPAGGRARRMSMPALDGGGLAAVGGAVNGGAVSSSPSSPSPPARRNSMVGLTHALMFGVRMQRRASLSSVKPDPSVPKEMPKTPSELKALLLAKYGTLRKAYKTLDRGGNGILGCHQLREMLVSIGLIPGGTETRREFTKLFKEMDSTGGGTLSFSDFVGDAVEPPPEENEEWHYLTTAEQWTRWCDRTSAESPKCRPPVWATPLASLNAVRDYEERRAKDLHRMRTMMAQGVHKTQSGLKLTAPHLLEDFDADTVNTYRRESLETVEIASKRIRHALQESARTRHDLKTCVEEYRRMELETKRAEKRDKLSKTRKAKATARGGEGRGLRVSCILTLDVVNMLTANRSSSDSGDEDDDTDEDG